MQILRIRELNLNFYFFDKKIEYISFDKSIDRIKVLPTCTNKLQLAKKSSKESIKQILYQFIEKKIHCFQKYLIW